MTHIETCTVKATSCGYYTDVSPGEPLSEEEQRQQMAYEEWLMQQANFLGVQVRGLEAQVTKLRRQKKSLSAKQRQVRLSHTVFTGPSGLLYCNQSLI